MSTYVHQVPVYLGALLPAPLATPCQLTEGVLLIHAGPSLTRLINKVLRFSALGVCTASGCI